MYVMISVCIYLCVVFVIFQTDSLFNLQRPYDLVAMLKQEDRAKILEDLKQELLIKKESIDKSDDRDTGESCDMSCDPSSDLSCAMSS